MQPGSRIALSSNWETYFEGTLESGVKYSLIGAAVAVASGTSLPIIAVSFGVGWGVVVISKLFQFALEQLEKKFPRKGVIIHIISSAIPVVLGLAALVTFFALSIFKIVPFLYLALFAASAFVIYYGVGFLGGRTKTCLQTSSH